ncbi:MAG: radical SAM family heme chaperone HemW [Burkholderiaceae bacterium]
MVTARRVIPIRSNRPQATAPRPGGAANAFVAPPLSLYLHLPWCLRKCPYCDFNSHERKADGFPEAAYVDALISDLEQALPQIWGRGVQTVFIGGGTPSLFSPDAIDRLLGAVRARVRLSVNAEITLEANPGTFERDRFAAFAQAGVNRLSIGVQSFDDAALHRLGRVHDAAQARAAIETAAECFPTFNIDLMYALPGQDRAGLARDLAELRRWQPPHVSLYHLTLEPNTRFARFPPQDLPDDDLADTMLDQIAEALGADGLERYEVSAYARPGQRCRHNVNYWQFGDYLGLGAGAHGKLTFPDRILREARYRHPDRYLRAVAEGNAVEQVRVLTEDDLRFEFMLNALRLLDGVPAPLFAAHTGLPLSSFGPALAQAVEAGLLDADPTVLRATPFGQRFLNDLTLRFLGD